MTATISKLLCHLRIQGFCDWSEHYELPRQFKVVLLEEMFRAVAGSPELTS